MTVKARKTNGFLNLKNPFDQLSLEEKRALVARLLSQRAMTLEAFPLSYAQERLWFMDQLQPGTATYNIPMALRFPGALDVKAMAWSFNEIVRRHETLRTTFGTQNDRPVQIIAPELTLQLPVVDLQECPASEREAAAERLAMEEARRGFDLRRGPLIRVSLLRMGPHDHVLLLTMHHIVGDAWSLGILFRELTVLYEAACRGAGSPLAPLRIQYADFAVWQRKWLTEARLAKQVEYWRQRLLGAPPELALPTDRPRPEVRSYAGMTLPFRCPRQVADKLGLVAREAGGTVFMVLLTAFKVLLHRYSGQADLVVGTPMANRNRAEIEGLIGFFVNMVVLRTDLSGNPSFRQALQRVKEVTLGAYDHADVPFERLVEELRPDRSVARNPIFQVAFALQNTPAFAAKSAAAAAQPDNRPREAETAAGGIGTAKFDLLLSMGEAADGLIGAFEYSTDLFDLPTIRQMQHHFAAILAAVAQDQDVRVLDITLRPDGECGAPERERSSLHDAAESFSFQ